MSENQGIPDTTHIRDQSDDETRVVTLRRQLLAARRDLRELRAALDTLQRYDGEGNPHERGIYVRYDDIQQARTGET